MIDIKIDDKKVLTLLRKLNKKTEDMTPAMRVIAGIMKDAVEENFAKEGPGWPKLAPSTMKQREKRGNWPGKILQQSGQLAGSISERADSHSARVGTNKVYGAIQQLGGKAGRSHKVNIPARPFLKLDNRALEAIKKAIMAYLTD